MIESTVLDMGRGLFAMFDTVIYTFLGYFYEIMTEISNVMIVSADQSNGFATKIYTLLGIFMLFKITFSLINYLVNPEAMSDKNKGVGKIAVNIVIVLVLIIITPTAFTKLYQLQNAILADDIIPKFILGSVEESELGKNQLYISEEFCGTGEENVITASNDGQYIALTIFRTFYQPDDIKYSNKEAFFEHAVATRYCDTSNNSISDYLDKDIYNDAKGTDFESGTKARYAISYSLLISTAVGIVVALLFLSFSIDIAVRSIKLSFLQIISPIPIISYLDPESGKKGMFAKWLKDVGKTWADLFIRLIAIYFAVYIIGIIGSNGFAMKDFNGNELVLNHSLMVPLFIMIGALVFAKRLPTIITDLTGIKLGGMQLNPFKKIEKEALGGKILGNSGKAVAGGLLGLGYGINGAATGAGPGRLLTGTFGGISQGLKGKKIGEISKNQIARNDVMRKARLDGSTFLGRVQESIETSFGTGGRMTAINEEKASLDKQISEIDERIKGYDDSMAPKKLEIAERKKIIDKVKSQEDRAKDKIKSGEGKEIGSKYVSMLAEIEQMKSMPKEYNPEQIAEKEIAANQYLNGAGIYEYINRSNAEDGFDRVMKGFIEDYEELARVQGKAIETDAKKRHDQTSGFAGDNSKAIRENEEIERDKANATDKKREFEKDKREFAEDEKIINADKSTLKK